MTQFDPPSEIKCPHCGQPYAMSPEQWPQYQGRSIACTKCGQPFAVGTAGGVPPLPPPMAAAVGYPQQGYGFPPPQKKGMSGGVVAAIVVGVICVVAVPCLIAVLLPALNKVRQEALKAKCSSNLKNIATAMINYSNANSGEYPDSMETLVRTSGMTPAVFVCPDSNDTPMVTAMSLATPASLAGHCSYIYAAGGLDSNTAAASDVLVYESVTDHHARGMNVLYGDYHVAWLNTYQANQMMARLSLQKLRASRPSNLNGKPPFAPSLIHPQ